MTSPDIVLRLRELSRVSKKDFKHEGAAPPWEAKATPDQVAATEDALGFLLPDSLKAIYTQLANGGFGPAYGLMSLTNDQYDSNADDVYIQAHYEQVRSWSDGPDGWRWPEGVISIADIGCGIRWCLDCKKDELIYFAGDSIDEEVPESFHEAFIRHGITFEQAIILWLDRLSWESTQVS